jgi:hypothetical protein
MARRPEPLTAKELCEIKERWGKDRLVRVLLWEVSRLRRVVTLLYRQIAKLAAYQPDCVTPDLDPEVVRAIESEPAIAEMAKANPFSHKYGRPRRWPHMPSEKEAALNKKMEHDADAQAASVRDLKRQSREAR